MWPSDTAPAATRHATAAEIEARLHHVRGAPRDHGRVEMLVARPRHGEREVLEVAEFDTKVGLVGDDWRTRGSSSTPDRSAHPGKQIAMISARYLALIAGGRSRWSLSGDQLIVDLDLSVEVLPAGTHLRIGESLLEVTPQVHRGCRLFAQRFGTEALAVASTPEGRALRLRGVYLRVVESGTVAVGDAIRRVTPPTGRLIRGAPPTGRLIRGAPPKE